MNFQPPKGTRDIIEEDAENLESVISVVRTVFKKYGFSPFFTPAFEDFDLLSIKGGLGESVKDDIYFFKDKSERELGLRFDLTMPMVRVVATNAQLKQPFKRYAIGKVWRYDNPQALRYREFWQADIDIIGSDSIISDVECLTATCECLDKLGFNDYFIRFNDRKLLDYIFKESIGIKDDNKVKEIFRSIDKMDKIGENGVIEELEEKGVENEKIQKILDFLKINGTNSEIIQKIEKRYLMDENTGINELLKYADCFGIDDKIKLDTSLVRGLDYYTGHVFEVYLGEDVSCGGGGRYDKLIEMIGGTSIPSTGISLGISRIVEIMKSRDMIENVKEKKLKIFVANVNENTLAEAIKITKKLRENEIESEMDLMGRNLSAQLEYANSSDADYSIIIGEDEIKSKKFTLKNMSKNSEEKMEINEIIKKMVSNGND